MVAYEVTANIAHSFGFARDKTYNFVLYFLTEFLTEITEKRNGYCVSKRKCDMLKLSICAPAYLLKKHII